MYQPDFFAYLDAIRQQYETILAENKSLKQENLRLAEANNQCMRKVHYMEMFNRQKYSMVDPPVSLHSRPAKCLKRGSDWFVDGDNLCEVSIREKIMMPSKITNAVISKCGAYIAFGCGYSVFLVLRGRVYFLNNNSEKIEKYEGGVLDKNLQDHKVCPMDFSSDSSYLYAADDAGCVRTWNIAEGVQKDSFKTPDPIALSVAGSLVFVIGGDRTLRAYENTRQVVSLNSNEDFSGPMVVSPNADFVYAIVGKNKILVFDMKTESSYLTTTSEEKILAMAVSPENMVLSAGGYGRTAGLYRIKAEKPSCRLYDTIDQRSIVLSLGFVGDHLLVGQYDGFVIWDVKQKKSMKVQMSESNVIGVSVCRGYFTTVDNNGALRLWSYKPTE